MMPRPVAKGEVHEENRNVFHFQFDHQFLHTLVEIVVLLVLDRVAGQEGIALLVHDRQESRHREPAVFRPERVVVAKRLAHDLHLVHFVRTDGAGVNLNQPDNVGVH